MKTEIVIVAVGDDKPGIINQLSATATNFNCNICETRMTIMAGQCTLLMHTSGEHKDLEALREELPRLSDATGLEFLCRHMSAPSDHSDKIPYAAEVVTIDDLGLVKNITEFFIGRAINIESMYTETYDAPMTGTTLFGAHFIVGIPRDCSINALRKDFVDYCDQYNMDATLELFNSNLPHPHT